MPKKYFIFLGILGLVMYYPFLLPGYVFSLDQAFSYYYQWPNFGANNFWVHVLGNIFQALHIPLFFIEKLVYIGMIGSIGYFGYKIFSRFQSHIATTFGIVFLFANPFFYARFIEGQVNIYISYALFVIFLYYFIEYFFSQKFKYGKHLVLVIVMLGLTSLHNVFLVALPLSIGYLSLIVGNKNKKYILKKLGFLSLILTLINSIWIVPTMMRDDLGTLVSSFGESHQSAFESGGGDYDNIYVNHLALKGYWGESEKRFYPSELTVPIDPIFFMIILLFVLLGIYSGMKDKKYQSLCIALFFLSIISYILSFGNSQGNIFSDFNNFLFENIPYYIGFREPHKWIMLVTFIYAIFASMGVAKIDEYIKVKFHGSFFRKILCILIILLPIAYTPAVLFGYAGQLQAVRYPEEWEQLRTYISQEKLEDCQALTEGYSKKCYSTLIFPWHGYINIGWTQSPIVLASIFKYFGPGALFGDTIEIRNIYTQSTRPESGIIEQYAPKIGEPDTDLNQAQAENFVQDVSNLGIEHIILLKESDYESYTSIFQSLEKYQKSTIIFENSFGTVYQLILE